MVCAVALAWLVSAPLASAQRADKVLLPGPSDVPRAKRLADEPASPADYRSPHFLLHTDLPKDEAGELLGKLERMVALVSKYWGQPLRGEIECYVVADLDCWPAEALSPAGRAKVRLKSGITTTRTLSRGPQFISGKSIVYAAADGGTPQHESVHAYCGQTFGRTGPLWYSEGMAELGQFWRDDDTAVHCKPHMIDYLHRHAKNVREIVADAAVDGGATATAFTGDSWQAYAARWALCHLLVHNPNYSARFRALGLGFLNGAPARFEDAFGSVLDEIDFEYRQFVLHLDQGYRVDLCRWDWDRKFRPATSTPINARVAAQRGWQASGAIVTKGETYQYRSKGAWRMDGGKQDVSADGQADGAGRLEAVVFQDFKLSEPFPLGVQGTFTAPSDGKLFLRCHDRWNELADNSGFVTVKIGKSARKAAATAEKLHGDFVIPTRRSRSLTARTTPAWDGVGIQWVACRRLQVVDPRRSCPPESHP